MPPALAEIGHDAAAAVELLRVPAPIVHVAFKERGERGRHFGQIPLGRGGHGQVQIRIERIAAVPRRVPGVPPVAHERRRELAASAADQGMAAHGVEELVVCGQTFSASGLLDQRLGRRRIVPRAAFFPGIQFGGNVNDTEGFRPSDLLSGKAEAAGAIQHRQHVLRQLLDGIVHFLDGDGFPAKAGMAVDQDLIFQTRSPSASPRGSA